MQNVCVSLELIKALCHSTATPEVIIAQRNHLKQKSMALDYTTSRIKVNVYSDVGGDEILAIKSFYMGIIGSPGQLPILSTGGRGKPGLLAV